MTTGPHFPDRLQRALVDHRPQRLRLTDARRAAVAAIIRAGHAGPELLFIHRADHPDDPWSGHMAFPGGRVDPGDHDGLAAARRETREEIGLALPEKPAGRLSDLQASSRGRRLALVIEPYVFLLAGTVTLHPDPREVQAVLWVPLSVLSDRSHRSSFLWRKILPMPCIRYQGRTIWGLTLRMADELLEVSGRSAFGSSARGASSSDV